MQSAGDLEEESSPGVQQFSIHDNMGEIEEPQESGIENEYESAWESQEPSSQGDEPTETRHTAHEHSLTSELQTSSSLAQRVRYNQITNFLKMQLDVLRFSKIYKKITFSRANLANFC